MLLPILLLLGSPKITTQQTTDIFSTYPSTYTTAQQTETDAAFTTFQTTPNFRKTNSDATSCKNQLLCPSQRTSTHSKGFPQVPSKNLVPPFTDSEEEELKTTTESVTDITLPTTVRNDKTPIILKKRDNLLSSVKPEVRSYPQPTKLTPSAAQIDLSYLPPQGVLPDAAAASLDIAKVNYLPPLEESPAAAQDNAQRVKPDSSDRDICTDSFHSFLCTPLKSRKRITGALPNSVVRTGFNPAASNSVPNSVKPEEDQNKQQYLPPSTPPSTTYAPQPSNIDRSYLPPKNFAASPSFNSVSIAKKTFSSTSTPRPFIQTSIIPFIAPKVIEQITTTKKPPQLSPEPSNEITRGYLPPSTTQQALSSFRQKPRTSSVRVITESSTASPKYQPAPSDNNYLPPSPKIEPAAAAQVSRALAPQREHHDHHDHHHHHHTGNICDDPFHSFLCEPLKQRKRITGALPAGFNPQSTNRKETRIKPEPKPENTFQSETRVKPTEEVPAANAIVPQIGYQYPKPSPAFPLPSQTSSTVFIPTTTTTTTTKPFTGYSYPKPSPSFALPSQTSTTIVKPSGYQYPKPSPAFPLPSQTSSTVLIPTTTTTRRPSTGYSYPKPSPTFSIPSSTTVRPTTTTTKPFTGYSYPKPSPSFALPSQTSTTIVKPNGYQYPKPSPAFPLPSQSSSTVLIPTTTTTRPSTGYSYPKPANPLQLPKLNVEIIPKEDRISPVVVSSGYQYPKPSIPFPLPSESRQQNIPAATSPKPQASEQRTGYQYPKPSQQLPLPTGGYQYPKPEKQLELPTERKSSVSALKDLGSAEFIPVNKIDAKRQVRTGLHGVSPKFGERLRSRVRQGIL